MIIPARKAGVPASICLGQILGAIPLVSPLFQEKRLPVPVGTFFMESKGLGLSWMHG
jgi:hypothetical protein